MPRITTTELVKKNKPHELLEKAFGKRGKSQHPVELKQEGDFITFSLHPEDFNNLYTKTAFMKNWDAEQVAGFIPHPKHIQIIQLRDKIAFVKKNSPTENTYEHEIKHLKQFNSRINSAKEALRMMDKFRKGKQEYSKFEYALKRILNDEFGAYLETGRVSGVTAQTLANTAVDWVKWAHEGTDTPQDIIDKRITSLRSEARDTSVYAMNNVQYGWTEKAELQEMLDTMHWDELKPILKKMRPEENR